MPEVIHNVPPIYSTPQMKPKHHPNAPMNSIKYLLILHVPPPKYP